MTDHVLSAADERAHRPSGDPAWQEWWYFDFAAPDGSVAGYLRLTLRPAERRAWWWSAVVGSDVPFVLVREHDVDPPRAGTLEVRASGLWAEPVCETPFEHWSVGLEAFGVGMDDPTEAYGRERGDQVPLGFDLEWEAHDGPVSNETGYFQPCTVHGDVLAGADRFEIDGSGVREHGWGVAAPGGWVEGRRDDGVQVDERGLIAGGLDVVYHAPLQAPPHRVARALCRVDGRLVWAERLYPASSTTG
jgi:hypothetical protein